METLKKIGIGIAGLFVLLIIIGLVFGTDDKEETQTTRLTKQQIIEADKEREVEPKEPNEKIKAIVEERQENFDKKEVTQKEAEEWLVKKYHQSITIDIPSFDASTWINEANDNKYAFREKYRNLGEFFLTGRVGSIGDNIELDCYLCWGISDSVTVKDLSDKVKASLVQGKVYKFHCSHMTIDTWDMPDARNCKIVK